MKTKLLLLVLALSLASCSPVQNTGVYNYEKERQAFYGGVMFGCIKSGGSLVKCVKVVEDAKKNNSYEEFRSQE